MVEISIILLVSLYFWLSALPTFDSPEWDFKIDYPSEGSQPAASILSFDINGDAASANLDTSLTDCTFPRWNSSCTEAMSDISWFNSTYGDLQHYQYDGLQAVSPFTKLSDQLVLKTWMTC